MTQKIELSIPAPCHEDWNKMSPADKGRFCGVCQKQVVDFTGLSQEQLIAFFKKPSTGSICGRFLNEQLDTAMDIPAKRLPWVRRFFQLALPALLFSEKAVSQGKPVVSSYDSVVQIKGETRGKVYVNPVRERIIEGIVEDKDGQAIPGAYIQVKETGYTTVTDNLGKFRIQYAGVADKITLLAEGVGYTQKEQRLSWKKKSTARRYVVFEMQEAVKPEEEQVVIAGLVLVKRN